MIVDTAPVTAADLVDSGASAFCHVVCDIDFSRTLCGLNAEAEDWCTDDPCDNTCLVCADLEAAGPPCPVCGTDCVGAA